MDYLRTLGSAAVSTLVQKSGLNLPFSLGNKVTSIDNICNLYDATKRDDGSPVSVFEYDLNDPSKRNFKPLAKNALRKLRTTRHPDVLKFMDAVESDTTIYIMTERVRPLSQVLPQWTSRAAQEREDWLLWGLHRISVALSFINEPCVSTHGNVQINSIFISPSGEWKLGGFELCSNAKDEAAILYTFGGLYPGSASWSSPEVKKSGWSALKEGNPAVADSYALGLLLHSVFNPNQPPPATAQPPHPPPVPSSRGAIPTSVFAAFKRLLNPNGGARLTPKGFLELGMTDGGFFANNRLVKVCNGLDNFSLASEADKTTLLRTLKESATSFPAEFASFKVLPSLVSALEFGGASAVAIIPLVLQFGQNVSPDDYQNAIIAPLVKLYASPDRGTRMALLEHLPEYVEKLDQKTVSDKIFPNLQTGFSDTVAVIREATVKSIGLLAPKFNPRILNNELLRHLAKMQADIEPSIRTNTCILLGRLGPTLGYNTKRKVLVPAFARALKDTFVHARVAGLMAFMATIDCFEIDELASKVIPCISPSLIDKEKLVRDQAFKAMELFVNKLQRHAETMPETALVESTGEHGDATMPGGLANSAAGAAGALAGWAFTSLSKKLVASDLQSNMATPPSAPGERPTSAPPPAGSTGSLGTPPTDTYRGTVSAAPSNIASPVGSTFSKPAPKGKGMQLGGSKASSASITAGWGDYDDMFSTSTSSNIVVDSNDTNPWGNDDLIDVNADQDDWSAFESVPPIAEPKPVAASSGLGFNLSTGGSHSSRQASTINHQRPSPAPPTPTNEERAHTPATASTNTIGMSKEDRAAEMARRKEERKQRIAMLKEQKKNAAKPS
ncbi:hypothetical protein AX16_010613 [Volvariella volvacea WC 439]|nr:hypothetical protein AX16_010613 [Volvariella volvacea WC 439]